MDNQQAFIEMVKNNEALIYKVTKLYANTKEDAEDLYQEIVYQLWKSFSSFRNESKMSTWIYRIALNTSITHLNKEKKRKKYFSIGEEILNRTDMQDTLQEEKTEVLYIQLKKLDTIEKGIVFLYLEGKSYDEMAAITGFTSTNIGTRLNRIKQKIIAQINK